MLKICDAYFCFKYGHHFLLLQTVRFVLCTTCRYSVYTNCYQQLAFGHLQYIVQAGELLKEGNPDIQPGWVTTMCLIVTGAMLPRHLLYSRDSAAAMEYLREQHGASMCFKAAFWLLFAFEATWADVRLHLQCASALKCTVVNSVSCLPCTESILFTLTQVFLLSVKLLVVVRRQFHFADVHYEVHDRFCMANY
jgi:hypothetical protein